MRASKSDSKDISEKSSVHSSTMMSEAATLRLVMEQTLSTLPVVVARKTRHPFAEELQFPNRSAFVRMEPE